VGIFGAIRGLFGSKRRNEADPEIFYELRNRLFTIDPKELELSKADGPVWGLVMETGYSEASFTLVALRDGTVSLYFSNGGGIIGIGMHETPSQIAGELLALAPNYLSDTTITTDYPVPTDGLTRFYFFTFDGIRTVEGKEDDMGNNRHALSPLFHKAHELIGASREAAGQEFV
jgi:hypothetical protein